MPTPSRMIIGVLLLVLAAFGTATAIGAQRQKTALAVEIERLIQSASAQDARAGINDALDSLPPPVARYLRLALRRPRQIHEVRLRQIGTLRTDVRSDRWMPFEAEHIAVPPASGFVWNARVRIAPLLHVRVRDALIEGKGSGHVSLLSAFTVSAAADTPEMNSGSLHRYLAEAVWYPTALLPGRHLTWTAIDRTTAMATLTTHGVSVSLEFRFADTGEVTGIYTPARWGSFPEGYRQAPWEGHFRTYRERDGLFVPTEGEVGWYVDNQWRAVWKGSITGFELRTGE